MSNYNKRLKPTFALNDNGKYTTIKSFSTRIKWILKLLIYWKNINLWWLLKPSWWICRRWIRKHLQIISGGRWAEGKQINLNSKIISLKSAYAKFIKFKQFIKR
jgi:hypothetical protein